MRFVKSFLFILVAIIGFSSVDVSAQTNAEIDKKVAKAIRKLPYYEVFDYISYKVEGRNVTLYGQVATAINKKDAEGYVKDIKGVENVINNIEILPPSSFDDSIRRQIVRNFYQYGNLSRYLSEVNPEVRIIVKNGRVTFEGIVSNQTDVNLMNIATNQILGVFQVTNNVKIKSEG